MNKGTTRCVFIFFKHFYYLQPDYPVLEFDVYQHGSFEEHFISLGLMEMKQSRVYFECNKKCRFIQVNKSSN